MYRSTASSMIVVTIGFSVAPEASISLRAFSSTSRISGGQASQIAHSGIPTMSLSTDDVRRTSSRAEGSPQSGSTAPKHHTLSSTLRVSAPTVSKVLLNGTTPSVGHRPRVVLWPTTPVKAAGIRIDPPVSDPRAIMAERSHRLTPAPQDEPPGILAVAGSQGLRGVPQCGLMPTPPYANSTVCVLPVMTAPAARARVTSQASSAHGSSGSCRAEPAKVGHPSTP